MRRPLRYFVIGGLLGCLPACGLFQAQPKSPGNPEGKPVAAVYLDRGAKAFQGTPVGEVLGIASAVVSALAGAGVVLNRKRLKRKVGELHARINAVQGAK